MRQCVCVCVFVFMCVCFCVSVFPVFLNDNSKRSLSRHMKFIYIVVYDNTLDKFAIGDYRIKVKVTAGV